MQSPDRLETDQHKMAPVLEIVLAWLMFASPYAMIFAAAIYFMWTQRRHDE